MIPEVLAGRYRIERELGAGGMATVYLAEDLRHHRHVAIKVLHPDLAVALGSARFLKEIQTTAQLQHPQILPLYDSGEVDGVLFYVMPFVDGETLRQRMDRSGALSVADAIRIARDVTAALDYAHRHGVIHRDIKPENILLSEGQTLVADFGIALAPAAGNSRLTETGISIGTPHYMSPEQALGERALCPRTDIYATGAMLYEMLTGTPPFTGSSAQAIVAKVITEKPVAPSRRRKDIPAHLDDVILTALQKIPEDRFASAAAFHDALMGHPDSPLMMRRRGRGGWIAACAAVLAILAVATRPWTWRDSRHIPTRHVADTAAVRLVAEASEFAKRRDPQGCDLAINLYSHATETDTAYAEAWAGLARASVLCAVFVSGDPAPRFAVSTSASEKALRLDPNLAGAYTARAMVHLFHGQDWVAAQRDFSKAIASDSTQYEPWLFQTWLYFATDSVDAALRSMRHAKVLAPVEAVVGVRLATTLRYTSNIPGAEEEIQQVLRRDPTNPIALSEQFEVDLQLRQCKSAQTYLRTMQLSPFAFNNGLAGYGEAVCGDRAVAQRLADSLRHAAASTYVDMFELAMIFAGLGDSAGVYQSLDKAITQHNWALFYLPAHYTFVPFHGTPQFEALKQRIRQR